MFTYEYIPHRGISRPVLELYDIKTKIDVDGKPVSVGFKYPNLSYKVRELSDKTFRWEGASSPGLFGRDRFNAGSNDTVTITEGEYDAASLYQVLGSPVVSVRSSSSAVADCVHERSWLNSFGTIVIAFDNDVAGREATRSVSKLFDYNKILVVNFDKRKDANEYLQNNESEELKTIWKNAKRYMPDSIISTFAEFKKAMRNRPKKGIDYPFPMLNDMLYGNRTSESVLFTAQEGVGKTEIMHAILHKNLKETDDAVGALFFEEPSGDLLRSLAGIELRMPTHIPDVGPSEDEIDGAVQTLCKVDDRLLVHTHYGSDDPDAIIDTIRWMVTARNVVRLYLDHISMVISGLASERDERRAFDYLSTRLEMLVKELNFGLIFVSHVNDDDKTRGSRYISKVADAWVHATRDTQAEDETVKNTTTLTVKKNRKFGKTGFAGKYYFDQYTRQYIPLLGNDNDSGSKGLLKVS